MISTTKNETLAAIPQEGEIFKAVQNLNEDSAPRLDGYRGKFYVKLWDIIKLDFTKAIQDLFLEAEMLKN